MILYLVFLGFCLELFKSRACRDFARGSAEYAFLNNTRASPANGYTPPEITWQSVVDESKEVKKAWNQLKMSWNSVWELILEIFDVVHSLIKHIIIKYLPKNVYTRSVIWRFVFLLVLPVGFKLAKRFRENNCIRNHSRRNYRHTCHFRERLSVYFAGSVRGEQSKESSLKDRINMMLQYVDVTTKHMADDNLHRKEKAVSDRTIYDDDIEILKISDFMVADVTNPSLGVGFMIREAIARGKTVYAFCSNETFMSAMIAGCPEITKIRFDDKDFKNEQDFEHQFLNVLEKEYQKKGVVPNMGKKVILLGPAGSGKSTAGRRLAKEIGAVHVSTGDLLRNLEQDDRIYSIVKSCLDQGNMVPAETMVPILMKRLNSIECRTKGFVLDGFPQSRENYDCFFKKYPIDLIDAVFYFDCPVETSVERVVNRAKNSEKKRPADTEDGARTRHQKFHDMVPHYTEMKSKGWFPDNVVIPVNATQDVDSVYQFIKTVVDRLDYKNVPKNKSYYIVEPENPKSTRVHFHLDGACHKSVYHMANRLMNQLVKQDGANVKVYPIRELALGPQTETDDAYDSMCNFHPIESRSQEAFITGKMGDMDMESLLKALETAYQHFITTGESTMAELEQYIREFTLMCDGEVTKDATYEPFKYDDSSLKDYKEFMNPSVPPYEFHLAFNLPKKGKEMPISLEKLHQLCQAAGMNHGGWFIFRDPEVWKYRSNEFVREQLPTQELVASITKQAESLQQILKDAKCGNVEIGFSIEIVHGIWNFQ